VTQLRRTSTRILRDRVGGGFAQDLRHWFTPRQSRPIHAPRRMRNADIRTTLNVYGDVATDEMAQANSKVARMALSRTN
jgi:hypothetical protein